jgi:hypothetical protein
LSRALAKAEFIPVGGEPASPSAMPHVLFLRDELAPDFIETRDTLDDGNANFLVQLPNLDRVLVSREQLGLLDRPR